MAWEVGGGHRKPGTHIRPGEAGQGYSLACGQRAGPEACADQASEDDAGSDADGGADDATEVVAGGPTRCESQPDPHRFPQGCKGNCGGGVERGVELAQDDRRSR